jgi:hypothetical protein
VATTAPTPDQQIAMAPTESAGTARSGTRPRGDNTRSGAAQSGDRKGTNTKAPASSESRRSPAGPEQSLDPQTAARLYQLVALQHFGRTEALLTAFRADSRRGGDSAVNARIADWSRELLSTTRLLLDSPAADDPQMRSLLGDLEVLLAKLAQHSGAGGGDVKIINDALGQGELLNRLRTAVPAGAATDVQGE